MTQKTNEDFVPLPFAKRTIVDGERSMYRVYRSDDDFESVEAHTAIEAMKESGIENPHKIVRDLPLLIRLMDESRLAEVEEEEIVPETPANEAEETIQAPTEDTAIAQEEPPASQPQETEAEPETTPEPEAETTLETAAEIQSPEPAEPAPESTAEAQAEKAQTEKDGLSPDDVAALLDGGE